MKIYRKCRDKHRESYINKMVNGDMYTVWKNIKKVLSQSKIIIRGPHGFYATTYPEFDLLLKFTKTYEKQSEVLLMESLLDDNPNIVAYCLVGLSLLKSSIPDKIAQELLNRKEIVMWAGACLRGQSKLGDFAKFYLGVTIDQQKVKSMNAEDGAL